MKTQTEFITVKTLKKNINNQIRIYELAMYIYILDTFTRQEVTSVLFGALEFGDYIIEASKLGGTTYVCSIPGHFELGMSGNFTIIQ